MKVENREKLIEAKGILTGLSYLVSPQASDAVDTAVELIETVLNDKEKEQKNEDQCSQQRSRRYVT